jgi:hypothetical protein
MISLPSLSFVTKGAAWLLAVLALLAALYFAERGIEQRGYDRAAAEYTATINAQKADAAHQLAALTDRARAKEQALQDSTNRQNVKDAKNAKTLADLRNRLDAGGLRDPFATAAGCGGSGAGTSSEAAPATGTGADHAPEAAGVLSAGFADLLRGAAAEADTINAAYASCQSYINTITITQDAP